MFMTWPSIEEMYYFKKFYWRFPHWMPSFKNRWSGNPRSHSSSRLIPFLSFLFFSIWALSPATCWAQPPTTKPLLIQSWHRNINVTEPKPSIKHLLGSLDCFKSVFENFFLFKNAPYWSGYVIVPRLKFVHKQALLVVLVKNSASAFG